MKTIRLKNKDIPYKIAKKNNKNTYYYFKKDGYIQINLAKQQSTRRALSYMKANAENFVDKYHTHCISNRDTSKYYLWGTPYQVQQSNMDSWMFDHHNQILFQPKDIVDQSGLIDLEMDIYHSELERLITQYKTNHHVNIDHVTYTIKSMTSRHGSCNKRKRRISMNLRLIHHAKQYMEYVFLHEIAHLVHDNHSKQYYELLSKLCPNYRTLRDELRQDF